MLNVSGATSALKEFATGFRLLVYLVEGLLPALHRLGDGFVNTAVGRIRFEKIGVMGLGHFEQVCAFYQGFPIRVRSLRQTPSKHAAFRPRFFTPLPGPLSWKWLVVTCRSCTAAARHRLPAHTSTPYRPHAPPAS